MTIKKHLHKVKRLKYKNGESVFFCTLDDCNFKIHTELSLGKTFACSRCGKPFTMNVLTKRMAKPHCDDCTKRNTPVPKELIEKIAGASVEDLRNRLRKSIDVVASPNSASLDEDML